MVSAQTHSPQSDFASLDQLGGNRFESSFSDVADVELWDHEKLPGTLDLCLATTTDLVVRS